LAQDQSIWDSGHASGISYDHFFGIDESWHPSIDIGVATAGGDATLKTGFQVGLHATLGNIDATLPFDLTIDTVYNKTTDTLEIDPSAALGGGGSFTTEGPGGSFILDFVFQAGADAYLHPLIGPNLDISLPSGYPPDVFDAGFNILDINSANASTSIDIPPGQPITTITIAWPQVNTTSDPYDPSLTNTISSDGTSNDLLNVNLDVIALAFAALGIPNPLDLGWVDLLSLTVNGGINLTDHFDLAALGLNATLNFENGTSQPFNFSNPLTFQNASNLDANHDGTINFDLTLTPDATLTNDLGLGFHIGGALDVLMFGDPIDTSLVHLDTALPVGDVPLTGLYDPTFALNFQSQDYAFAA
jgi:hypothetical protein